MTATTGARTGPDAASVPDTASGFDPARSWDLHPGVSVRPEPFGALLYHFGTRRLTFLKDRRLLDVVTALAGQPSALAACRAAGVEPGDVPRYTAALARLAGADMLVRREETP
jgi:putative mycofactocin binding protein MftB